MTNVGTQIKFNISLELPGILTMDDVRFFFEFFVFSSKIIKIEKADMVRVDANNYEVICDTTLIGRGDIRLRVTAYIPEDTGERLEIETVSTRTMTI